MSLYNRVFGPLEEGSRGFKKVGRALRAKEEADQPPWPEDEALELRQRARFQRKHGYPPHIGWARAGDLTADPPQKAPVDTLQRTPSQEQAKKHKLLPFYDGSYGVSSRHDPPQREDPLTDPDRLKRKLADKKRTKSFWQRATEKPKPKKT